MPLYEYECAAHGVFERARSMAEASLGAACPECAENAPRILSVPRLACVSRAQAKAHAVNERSRHEPRHVERPGGQSLPRDAPKLMTGHGRPWALGH